MDTFGIARQDQVEIFGEAIEDHADDDAARWGDRPEFAESRHRMAGYGREEWAAIKDELDAIVAALAAARAADPDPTSPAARAAAERHRRHIDLWYYPIGHAMHADLGDIYVGNERFAAVFAGHGDDFVAYVRDTFHANAAAHATPAD